MSRFQPKLVLPTGAMAPDEWDESIASAKLPDEFVVSRFADGKVASRLGDIYWNWSPYDPEQRARWLAFNYWKKTSSRQSDRPLRESMPPLRQTIVAGMQRFMALVIYKKRGASLTFASLQEYARVFRAMGAYCEKNGVAFDLLWQSSDLLEDFCSSLDEKSEIKNTARAMSVLMAMDPVTDIGFELGCAALISGLHERINQYPKNRQTPPMPTRIYSIVLATFSRELDEFSAVEDRYLALVRRIVSLCEIPAKERRTLADISWLLDEYNLAEYFANKELASTVGGVSAGLSAIQVICRLTVIAYSGMRRSEALALPYKCASQERSFGMVHHLLEGRTTKLEHGRIRRTRWVTSREGFRAVNIARRIAVTIYEAIGDVPKGGVERINRYPLFIAPSYLRFTSKPSYQKGQDAYQTSDTRLSSRSFKQLMTRLCPLIEEQDLDELEQIDIERVWRDESDYQPGKPWPLRMHQFRRSLALYAQRSGIVSLPSLRRQLQHITKEMSLYYSKGSIFAKNFIEDEPDEYNEHICKEWREAKPVAEAIAFLRDVVFSEERLFGAAGIFEEQKKKRGQVVDRNVTILQFKKGLTAYKETPFGGCVKIGECDKVGIRLMGVLCLEDCKSIVIKLSKLNRAIAQQQHLIELMDPSSPTYVMEKIDLDAMLKARTRCVEMARREGSLG